MKKQTETRIIRKTAGIAAAVICSGCIVMSALADTTETSEPYADGPTSNLWLSVVELPSQARISVTVPTNYGFAVVGSVETGDTGPVTSSDGTILLSNVRVEVTRPGSGSGDTDGEYTITTVGLPQVPVENYSTDVREEHLGEDNPPREGMPVEIKPYVVEVPDMLLNNVTKQHYWKPVETDPTGERDLFKRYRMGLDGKWFENKGSISDGKNSYDAYFLGENLPLAAPPDVPVNGWNAGGTAKVPYRTYFDVDVQVGGIRNQYNQVEQSVKVGKIGWEIIPGELPEPGTP